jgi:hypothetical protein
MLATKAINASLDETIEVIEKLTAFIQTNDKYVDTELVERLTKRFDMESSFLTKQIFPNGIQYKTEAKDDVKDEAKEDVKIDTVCTELSLVGSDEDDCEEAEWRPAPAGLLTEEAEWEPALAGLLTDGNDEEDDDEFDETNCENEEDEYDD